MKGRVIIFAQRALVFVCRRINGDQHDGAMLLYLHHPDYQEKGFFIELFVFLIGCLLL